MAQTIKTDLERALELVDQALDAIGGEAALAGLNTIRISGDELFWEHEYSFSAMPVAEVREGSKATFTLYRDLSTDSIRMDWDRDIVRLKFRPYPTLYKYSEIIADDLGYVDGIDTSTPTLLTKLSDPPGSPMSSIRLIVTLRDLTRESPKLLLDMKENPGALMPLDDTVIDGRPLPTVQYRVPVSCAQTEISDWLFLVIFDPETGLPLRIRTKDGDPIQGTTKFDVVFSDWRKVEKFRIPFHRMYKHNERDLLEINYIAVEINPDLDNNIFDMPITARAASVRSNCSDALTNIPYQWTLRRIKWGGDLNSDAVAWDATAHPKPSWKTILPGVDWTDDVTHNSTMIEMDDYLVVWEASLHENFSEWMIHSLKQRYPEKPIKYLILSHHHLDHNGGARPFVAEGAKIIVPVGPGYRDYFNRLFTPESPYLNDRLHKNQRAAEIIEIEKEYTLSDGKRELKLYNIMDGDHAPGLLIAYIPDVELLINTDLWNTNEKLGEELATRHKSLLNAVNQWGVTPKNSVSGHGPMVEFTKLSSLPSA